MYYCSCKTKKKRRHTPGEMFSIRRHHNRLICFHVVVSLFSFGLGTLASDVIPTGHNITDGNTLVSAGGSFTLGFFSPPGSGSGTTKRYLGIWFTFSNVTESICWVANRDDPLNDTSGVLVLNTSGTLLLQDGSNNTVWSSGSTSPNATGAHLLDSGNLVVQGGPDNRKAVWQSFDQPCNALLAGMKIGNNMWNGAEWYLSSWRSATDPGTGSYRYITEPSGGGSTLENVLWDGDSTKIYRTGPWNGERFDGVPEMASYSSNFTYQVTITNDGEVTYGYTAKPGAPYSQLRLSEAGVVQRLVWDGSNQQWNSFTKEPRDDCDDYAHCGPFGLCDSNAPSRSLCSCFNGFVPVSPSEWSIRDYSGGCQRSVPLDCSSNKSRDSTDGFYVVSLAKLPDTQNASVDLAASLDDCRVRCLANCSCVAFAAANLTGVSGCISWTNSFVDLRLIDGGQDFFIRMPMSLIAVDEIDKKNLRLAIVSSIAGILLVGGMTIFVIFWWSRRRNTTRHADNPSRSLRPSFSAPSISYKILKASVSFSPVDRIGQGSFGTVYKGQLRNVETARIGLQEGETVALKVLKRSDSNCMISYERELNLMSRLSHVNLVRLLAFCNDVDSATDDIVVLIYEYTSKGSLDHCIFDNTGKNRAKLSWKQRLQIISSIAEGILYLHVGCGKRIIHHDLKPANVLLDDDWTPKIADFGLAKHFTDLTALHTPFGPHYSAPECWNCRATDKSDVYSFGVMLLEIISGTRNGVLQNLVPNAWNSWNNDGHNLKELLDPEVSEEDEPMLSTKLERCIQIGLLCVQLSPDRRPHISEVVEMLKTQCPLPRPESPILICPSPEPAAAMPSTIQPMTTTFYSHSKFSTVE